MSSTDPAKNINTFLNQDFLNFNYLPQKIDLEDIDRGMLDYIKSWNLSIIDENGLNRAVPVIFTTAELWAERKQNWKSLRDEYGEEITRPFLALTRIAVEQGTLPLKRTIPKKMQFTYVKVPIFDGNLKNYVFYKVPQPTWVDISYNLTLVTYYMSDVNRYYEKMIRDQYSDGQGYLNINGYHISSNLESTSQTKEEEYSSENLYEIAAQIMVHGRLVDSTQFEKIVGANKFLLNMQLVQKHTTIKTGSPQQSPSVISNQLLSENSTAFGLENGNFLDLET